MGTYKQKIWKLPIFCNLFLLLLLVQLCSNLALAGSLVKSLPGFDGPLPFELETGYIGVGESENVQLFYYFIKSESNPQGDPLMLWLTGGPGCSSFSGLVYEIGPIRFEAVRYYGSLPKLVLNPHSWTKVVSIIFLDLPVGTGFSYGRTPNTSSTDLQACDQAYEFLKKWLVDHPKFISNPFYVGGESYAGKLVPVVTQLISNGNAVGIEPRVDLKGYLSGNPLRSYADTDYYVQFAHGMGLISDELYESLKETCRGNYHDIDPSNAVCLQNKHIFNQLLKNIEPEHILEPSCPYAVQKPRKSMGGNRALYEFQMKKFQELEIGQQGSPVKCPGDLYQLSYYWANDESVQQALHVRKGSIEEWQ